MGYPVLTGAGDCGGPGPRVAGVPGGLLRHAASWPLTQRGGRTGTCVEVVRHVPGSVRARTLSGRLSAQHHPRPGGECRAGTGFAATWGHSSTSHLGLALPSPR